MCLTLLSFFFGVGLVLVRCLRRIYGDCNPLALSFVAALISDPYHMPPYPGHDSAVSAPYPCRFRHATEYCIPARDPTR